MREFYPLLLVTGAPRSTTTAFHNGLIEAGIYRGVIGKDTADRDPVLDPALYTDEYYPSLRLPFVARTAPTEGARRAAVSELGVELDRLAAAFSVPRGLMLKAPHYAYSLDVYRDIVGQGLHVVFTHRDPFAVAASMTKHPHISRQLPCGIDSCTDFMEHDPLALAGAPEIVAAARAAWPDLSLFERALFVWWIFAASFLKQKVAEDTIVLRNDAFDAGSLRRLGDLLRFDAREVEGFASHYRR